MKTFINKATEITFKEPISKGSEELKVTNMTFADLAKMSLNSPPQGGWTTDEMRTRLKVTDKLEDITPEATVEFEDAEFAKIVECSKIKWNFMHKDIVAYEDFLLATSKT